MSFFADYDMAFFIEHHMARCPVTGKPEVLVSVSEDDPNYEPLAPEKQWRPEACPGYRPRQEPSFAPYTTEVSQRVVGVWRADYGIGGAYDATMLLFPSGDGIWDFWNMGAYCGRQRFKWRLDGVEHICFEGMDQYFLTESPRFQIGNFTNARGEQSDMLQIFDRDEGREPTSFFRSKESLDDYRVDDQDG